MNFARVCDLNIKGAEEKEEVLFYKDMSNNDLVSFRFSSILRCLLKKAYNAKQSIIGKLITK